jgi:hypothetical protein
MDGNPQDRSLALARLDVPISLNPAAPPAECPAVPVLETSEIGPVSYAETKISKLKVEVGESNEWNPAWSENLNQKMPMWGYERFSLLDQRDFQCTRAHFSSGTTTVPLFNLNLMFSRLSAPLFPAAVGLGCNPLCRQRPPSHQTAHLTVGSPEKAEESKRADTAAVQSQ